MRGSCLCGEVIYEVFGQIRSVVACHCTQCRKTSGHHVAATQVEKENLRIHGSENLTWFQSSATAKRAFCKTCGSQLFWTELFSDKISIMAGTLDGVTGLKIDRQICIDTKGDYYALLDVETVDQSTL